MGGAVTLTTTVTFPDTFRKVVLVDTGAGGDGERLSGDAAVSPPALHACDFLQCIEACHKELCKHVQHLSIVQYDEAAPLHLQ